jgi:putative intracellular protease/amidase
MKILMVLTSHDQLGDTGKKTGFWLEEFAAPYYVFKDAGADITLATAGIKADAYDAVFYPGGHGPLWDLAEDEHSIALIQDMWKAAKPVAAVCHAPAVFRHTHSVDGQPLVQGRKVTGFSNSEEAAVGLTDVVPFLVEEQLVQLGGQYAKGEDWGSYVQVDGRLITGQNPASSAAAAQAVIKQLS